MPQHSSLYRHIKQGRSSEQRSFPLPQAGAADAYQPMRHRRARRAVDVTFLDEKHHFFTSTVVDSAAPLKVYAVARAGHLFHV